MTASLLRDQSKSEETHNASCEFGGKISAELRNAYSALQAKKDQEIATLKTEALEYARVREEFKEVSANEKEQRDHMHTMSRQIDERDETIE